jgi:hypothetical protein
MITSQSRQIRPLLSAAALALAACLLLCLVEAAYARGGGGGGGHGGGGGGHGGGGFGFVGSLSDQELEWLLAMALVVLVIAGAYIGFLHHVLAGRGREAEAMVRRLAAADVSWNPDVLQRRISEVYAKVQRAWTDRDQDIAKDCISGRLYQLHKTQTDQMIRQHRQNVLNGISLDRAMVVGVADYAHDPNDSFWVYIEGSMFDYTIDDRSGEIVKGDDSAVEHFHELWKFVRGEHDWVLDEIVQQSGAGIIGLEHMHTFSRGLAGHQPLRRYGGDEA